MIQLIEPDNIEDVYFLSTLLPVKDRNNIITKAIQIPHAFILYTEDCEWLGKTGDYLVVTYQNQYRVIAKDVFEINYSFMVK